MSIEDLDSVESADTTVLGLIEACHVDIDLPLKVSSTAAIATIAPALTAMAIISNFHCEKSPTLFEVMGGVGWSFCSSEADSKKGT